jgi:hypothetical protein
MMKRLKKVEWLCTCEGCKSQRKLDRIRTIRAYAENYHYPMFDFKGFNKILKVNTGMTTTRKKLAEVMGW